MIVVRLRAQRPTALPTVLPAADQIGAGHRDFPERQRDAGNRNGSGKWLLFTAGVGISLDHERICFVLPVGPESDLALVSGVILRVARLSLGVLQIEVGCVDAEIHIVAEAASVSKARAILTIAATGDRETSLGLTGRARDDIDHAIDGIDTPQCAPRAADDFDAIDVLEDHILDVPEHAGE